jgi:hypothetical protein
MDDSKSLKNIDKKLSALIALNSLLVFGREDDDSQKPEVVLARAGLETSEIARLLGKALPAVQKTLQRAKKK